MSQEARILPAGREDGEEKRIPGSLTSHHPVLLEHKLKFYVFNSQTKMFVVANESQLCL